MHVPAELASHRDAERAGRLFIGVCSLAHALPHIRTFLENTATPVICAKGTMTLLRSCLTYFALLHG